ncbi:MAG TPA: hypothetical protein ENO08_07025 [Candidatus Eisenbacteria bacterium]|uniref:Uncharacterized protein n=1 Tax=Eiseniibacteriota bacterium TaxID=2212470 RepID=A0A7V2F3R2_UNCEI|nr:hypothetical protein [Candidatus Eisenbacteria bacterium]
MSRFVKSFLIVAVLSGFIAGCGGSVDETYVMVSLREATRGDVLSPGFKYSFDKPNFVAVHKNVGLVREDNLVEVFVGDGLEETLGKVAGGRFSVLARKFFEPVIHFNIDYLVMGADSMVVGTPYEAAIPNMLRTRDYNTDEFIEVDLGKLTTNRLTLKEIQDTKFKVSNAKVMYEMIADEMHYTLHLPNVRFIIEEPGDDIVLILKALMNEKLYFSGGVSYGTIPSQTMRNSTDSGGYVKVDYVAYGNRYIVVR